MVRRRRSELSKAEARVAWIVAGRPRFAVPVDVEYWVAQRRMMDDDNVVQALKPVRDALFARRRWRCPAPKTKSGFKYVTEPGLMLPDDDPSWFRLAGVWIRNCKPGEKPSVKLIIRERVKGKTTTIGSVEGHAGCRPPVLRTRMRRPSTRAKGV